MHPEGELDKVWQLFVKEKGMESVLQMKDAFLGVGMGMLKSKV